MIEITADDLLMEPETKRLTPLGRLTTIFDVIVSNPTSTLHKDDIFIHSKLRYKIERIEADTEMPKDYVRFYCHQVKEFNPVYSMGSRNLFV